MNCRHRWNSLKRLTAWTILAGIGLPVAVLQAQKQQLDTPGITHLIAGPAYTSADGKGMQKFPRVDVVFSAVGANGQPAPIKPSDLQLFWQNKSVATASSFRSFDQTGYGVTSILAIDASGSMRGAPLNAIHTSIAKFVGQARPQDKVGVVTFADDTRMDVPFDHTQDQMTAELQTVKARGTTTHLWDGLLYALDQYKSDSPARRLLVVISDGHDEGSQSRLEAVIARAKELNVVVSSIGLTRDKGQYLHFLQQLSGETGGSYRRAMSAAQLDGLIQDGLAAQRATPVALFTTSGLPATGSRQTVELRWLPGSLSSTTTVLTPKAVAGEKPPPNKVDRLWLWGLGGCFVAGIILLAISWQSSRRKPMPVDPYAAQMPGGSYGDPPPPPPTPYVPVSDASQVYERPVSVPRLPTIDESEYTPHPAPKHYVPTATPYVETQREKLPPRGPSRNVTQLAGVFDAPPEGPYALLSIKTGDLGGTVVSMTAPHFSIGAVPGNHLMLTGDPTISGHHARLLWEDGILKVEDNLSTNGTYLNGLKLEAGRHVVRPGDELRTGKVIMTVNPV